MRVRLKSLVNNITKKSSGLPSIFIGLEDVESGTGKLATSELPTKIAEDGLAHAPGDVLFGKLRPYLAKSYLATKTGTATSEFLVLRPSTCIDSRYLLYCSLSKTWIDWATATSYGTKMPRTSWELMGNYQLDLPNLIEQRRIADFLDAETSRIDQLIGASLCQTQLLDEHLHETIRSCTTLGLPGREYHSASTSIDWMPTINATWRLHKVAHNFISGSGTTPPSANENYYGGDIPWVNSADVVDSEIWSTSRKITQNALRDFAALKVHPAGSLVIALYGHTKGRVGILRIDATVNQACCALLPISNLSTEYSFYWFRAHKSGVITLAQGAGQQNLSQQLIQQLYIPAPTPQEQNKIVDYLDKMERQIKSQTHLIEKRISLLAERRRALITAAVTGEFDVSTASGRGIED